MQRACTALALLSMAAGAHGANCTARFANLTTCSVFNGVPASGNALQIAATSTMQESVVTAYGADTGITRSESCMGIHHAFRCLTFMHLKDETVTPESESYRFGVPCNGGGELLKACVDWCYQYANACYSGNGIPEMRENCKTLSAPAGQPCFGDNGVLGMKPRSSASSSRPSARWVALPLAVAAVRLGGAL
jgi:hypothetical protein